MPFKFERLEIPDVILVEMERFEDDRGFFMETYKESTFGETGIDDHFVQDNHSFSTRGVLRGLHYQLPPRAQSKLVRCISGVVFDVAVDIRRGSPYYGDWVGVHLSERNSKALYIPEGFAHGFLAVSEEAHVFYKVSAEYEPELETGIIWNDATISIDWPVKGDLIISEKDSNLPTLHEADNNFSYRG